VFDPETTAFLEAGSALIVGTVGPDGEPHAGRAWGLDVEHSGTAPVVRLLLDVDDATTIEHVAGGGPVSVTATSVRDLRSLQLKGRALGLDDERPDDVDRSRSYSDEFFTDIVETDATDRELVEELRPFGVRACLVRIEEQFVQTPGPGAGARLEPGGRAEPAGR
jgi:hypothetical protein